MKKIFAIGLGPRIILVLGLIFMVFTISTELTISSIVKVALTAQTSDPLVHLTQLREQILFFLIVGAVVALVVVALAINKIALRPLARLADQVEQAAESGLSKPVPVEGSRELMVLGSKVNHLLAVIRAEKRALRNKIDELEKAKQHLQKTQNDLIRTAKLASVGTLAAGVAHEIGNPVAGVIGLLNVLEGTDDIENRQRFINMMKKEMTRIDHTICELLTFARPRDEQDGPASCALDETIYHVKTLLLSQKPFNKITLDINLEPKLPLLAITPGDLSALLLNLMLNAGQAMTNEGVIQVTARLVKPDTVQEQAVEIAIADHGPGIAPETADRIFEPFYSGREGGTGLGLSVVQAICERTGGTIALDTTYHPGARFIITLPAAG